MRLQTYLILQTCDNRLIINFRACRWKILRSIVSPVQKLIEAMNAICQTVNVIAINPLVGRALYA